MLPQRASSSSTFAPEPAASHLSPRFRTNSMSAMPLSTVALTHLRRSPASCQPPLVSMCSPVSRRRDTGEHIDTSGGWHDAGDLRKWVSATVLNGIALMELVRNLGDKWDAAGSGAKVLLEEARWGNIYFLKMQDKDGYVWNDVAGGVNGDNNDNHWTDNRTGTPDDRYIETAKSG